MSQLPTKYHDHLTFANQLSSLDIILMHHLPLKRLSTNNNVGKNGKAH